MLGRDVADVLVGMLLAGIVDHDVEPAPFVDCPGHQRLRGVRLTEIAGKDDRLRPFRLAKLLRLRGIVVFAQIRK